MRSLVAAAVLALAGAAAAAPGDIQPAALLDHIKFLSSDELQGRGAGTPELERAADYVAQQFRAAGLQPGGDGGTWFQPFELVAGITVGERNELSFSFGSKTARFTLGIELLPARGARQRLDGHSLHDPRRRAARLCRLRAGGAVASATTTTVAWTCRARPSSIFSHEPQERLSSSAMNGARPVMESTLAAKEGAARSRGARGAHRHRRPVPPVGPGRLHAVLEGPRRRRPADSGAARAAPRGPAARRPVSARRPRPPDRRRPRAAIDGAERRHDDLRRAPDEEPAHGAQRGGRAAGQRSAPGERSRRHRRALRPRGHGRPPVDVARAHRRGAQRRRRQRVGHLGGDRDRARRPRPSASAFRARSCSSRLPARSAACWDRPTTWRVRRCRWPTRSPCSTSTWWAARAATST